MESLAAGPHLQTPRYLIIVIIFVVIIVVIIIVIIILCSDIDNRYYCRRR